MTSMIVERWTSLRREPAIAVGQPVEALVELLAGHAQRPQPAPAFGFAPRPSDAASAARAASAGDRVSETSVEIAAAAAIVTANWR